MDARPGRDSRPRRVCPGRARNLRRGYERIKIHANRNSAPPVSLFRVRISRSFDRTLGPFKYNFSRWPASIREPGISHRYARHVACVKSPRPPGFIRYCPELRARPRFTSYGMPLVSISDFREAAVHASTSNSRVSRLEGEVLVSNHQKLDIRTPTSTCHVSKFKGNGVVSKFWKLDIQASASKCRASTFEGARQRPNAKRQHPNPTSNCLISKSGGYRRLPEAPRTSANFQPPSIQTRRHDVRAPASSYYLSEVEGGVPISDLRKHGIKASTPYSCVSALEGAGSPANFRKLDARTPTSNPSIPKIGGINPSPDLRKPDV